MADPVEVILDVAAPSDAGVLANLLELYQHDLSEVFPSVELRADGRFGYDTLPLYWSEPEGRFPFLIRYGTGVVGFVYTTTFRGLTSEKAQGEHAKRNVRDFLQEPGFISIIASVDDDDRLDLN
jgi:hypothetical protein